jgi:hypothetical protein
MLAEPLQPVVQQALDAAACRRISPLLQQGQHGDCTCDLSTPLGSGSFGMVVPGWYYDEPVAVKLLSTKFGEDEAAVRSRILREVQLQVRRGCTAHVLGVLQCSAAN